MQKIKQWTRQLVYSRHMLWGVGLVSFLESIFLPVPLEAILIPLMQTRRDRLWLICLFAVLGCLLGATLGYFLGAFLFEEVGQALVALMSSTTQFTEIQNEMQQQGFWYVLSIGVTPVPFQIAMLAAGMTGYAFYLFLLATLLARSLRYFGLGLLVWVWGNEAEKLFQRYQLKAVFVVCLIVVGGWLMALKLS